jgi:tRNA(Ser,Leu) C12 N-acetylase TAN1
LVCQKHPEWPSTPEPTGASLVKTTLGVQALEQEARAKIIVTGRNALEWRQTRQALCRIVPGSKVRAGGFTNVFVVEAPGDALAIAERITQECAALIGHATAVITETASLPNSVQEAAVRVGLAYVKPEDTFCFRLRKRGAHLLFTPTPQIEVQIGSALWLALQDRDHERPGVELKDPDVLVLAEVLGPTTAVGIVRKAWRRTPKKSEPERGESPAPPHPDVQ